MIKPLALEEIKPGDTCYVIYDPEDPEVHEFKVNRVVDLSADNSCNFIEFERELRKHCKSMPNLFKDGYLDHWVAFKECPDEWEIKHWKRRLYHGKTVRYD